MATSATETKATQKGDLIFTTVQSVEKMDESTALKALGTAVEDGEFNNFRIGCILSLIQRNQWFKGYANLKELVKAELGMEYRKAMYLIGIANDLVAADIPWDKVKSLGWTKLSRLSPILNKENVDEWVEKAKNLTVLQLEEAIKAATSSTMLAPDTEQPTSTVETMTFKLHSDQKETVKAALSKCKGEVGTDVDTVALEHICLGYITGSVGSAPAALSEQGEKDSYTKEELVAIFHKITPDQLFEAFEEVWPHINVTVDDGGVEAAQG